MKKTAQTATELAVFGAILIFLIGLIVQQAMGINHLQNQSLRSVRLAMKFSYLHSAGLIGPERIMNDQVAGNKSRDFASVLIIEDRLSVDSGKFGPFTRAPSVSGASGTHSRNYFMPLDANRIVDVPKYDIFINGKHIPLATADFKTVCLTQTEALCPPGYDPTNPRHHWIGNYDPNFWEPNCVSRAGSPPTIYGCARLYAIASNNPNALSWCSSGTCPNGWSLNQRFNLDRDPGGTVDVPGADMNRFSWQWVLVSAFDIDTQARLDGKLTLLKGEGIGFGKEEGSEVKNLTVDVDNDLQEESLIRNDPEGEEPPVFIVNSTSGVVEMLMVLDQNEGDIDFGYDTVAYRKYLADPVNNPPPPGLTKDVAMYTRVSPDTYMEITDQGAAGTVRSAQRKQHIDLVQRILEISNNTGRFCDTAGNVVNDPNIWWDATNPVEACSTNCFDPSNIALTCFDTDDTRLFIRSRVADFFGHQWITNVSGDPYVNFNVPAL